eukprot:gene28437-34330_t
MSFAVNEDDVAWKTKPYVDGAKVFSGGMVEAWDGPVEEVTSPILDGNGNRVVIGRIAQMDQNEAMRVAAAARAAWNGGQGIWPQMTMHDRIDAIQRLVVALKGHREEIINTLMWEICKTLQDATAEFDRTINYIDSTIQAIINLEKEEGGYTEVSGILARVRRGAIGVMLALGPFNYPFNETYTTLIPSLLMGNVVVMKIPTVGGLSHVLTMEAYANTLPPGVINFVSGPGRITMTPIMESGPDIFAFIGGSKAADALLASHPALHRLKTVLSLEGKNLGIDADVNLAAEQCMVGSTSFNGQRCTAIKLIFLSDVICQPFLDKLIVKVNGLTAGLPWENGVQITPLPEADRVSYLSELLSDAVSKGAHVLNERGGQVVGNIFLPAVIFPVNSNMRVYHEEQFGPVIPVVPFTGIEEIRSYLSTSKYGQQAAIFSSSPENLAGYVDLLSNAVGRININTQCGRSPDSLPFSGRRSSSMGTLSVTEAIKVFSVETVVAGKSGLNGGVESNEELIRKVDSKSKFLAPL